MSFRRANNADKAIVVDILVHSFVVDPHVSWLLERCDHPNKLRILMNYIFEETISKGEIYIHEDECAVALWDSERPARFTFQYILRHLQLFFRIGPRSIHRMLGMELEIHKIYPKKLPYFHLYLLAVSPEMQGRGYASKMLNPVLEQKVAAGIPVYLETANPANVEIYKKKGFRPFSSIKDGKHELFLMKKD